ncbi:hypothetical protein [Fusobacterium sp. PH5-44]|uniref:hypothetical protein n=1 Tax=unclassified Fusobacterium TaxID=2648384 RepID=UPI003D235BDC
MEFIKTKTGRYRGAMADGYYAKEYVLIKVCPTLKLTYQIKLLTYRAIRDKLIFVLSVPIECELSQKLKKFQKENEKNMIIERR